MILSGIAIGDEVKRGRITIDPYLAEMRNPNSHNYRLGNRLIELDGRSRTDRIIGPGGAVLQPGRVYLGHTAERIGSFHFTPSLIGRSSIARLGLFLVADADHGQLGPAHRWTLELRAVRPLRIYAGMPIGQVSFWCVEGGRARMEASRYTVMDEPGESHLWGEHLDFER